NLVKNFGIQLSQIIDAINDENAGDKKHSNARYVVEVLSQQYNELTPLIIDSVKSVYVRRE
ncbi:unnamed protein product, partial [Rotaria sp. Silwood1]